MQLNTDSITAARVESPPPTIGWTLDPVGLVSALAIAACFSIWFSRDVLRERKWFEERKRRMAHFRAEARRRHTELVAAAAQERPGLEGRAPQLPATSAPLHNTPVDTTPKQRKLFKLYG